MCGIVGISSNIRIEEPLIKKVKKSLIHLKHRGPDEQDIWITDVVVLGHTRLSIVDIEFGHQPMVIGNAPQRNVIVFNGEIYNFENLRRELLSKAYKCQTRSDTEVLLRVLIEYGIEEGLRKICGMFAFAWYTEKEKSLFLARDRIGIKPLYYYYHQPTNTLIFSSSLEALIEFPIVPRRLNVSMLGYYFSLGFVPSPFTLYKDIYELPPGCWLKWQKEKQIIIKNYWDADKLWFLDSKSQSNQNIIKSKEEFYYKEKLEELIEISIQEHMIGDVHIGAFLSGGIDSSVVVYFASKHFRNKNNFKVYTVSFPDKKYDESSLAIQTARKFGVRHKIIKAETIKINEDMCKFILYHVGQPFADSSCIPTYLVSKAVSGERKVALSGDGGDELFYGYEIFSWGKKINKLCKLPEQYRTFIRKVLKKMDKFKKHFSDLYRQVLKALDFSFVTDKSLLIFYLKSIIKPYELNQILTNDIMTNLDFSHVFEFLKKGEVLKFEDALGRFLLKYTLPGDMLRKVDSMSMATSLEVRVPLLDHRIVEFAIQIPINLKIKGRIKKWILREIIKPFVPLEIIKAPKWGFAIPLHRYFGSEFLDFAADILRQDSKISYLVRKNFLKELITYHRKGNSISHIWSNFTLNHVLWMMVLLELWLSAKKVEI